MSHGNLQEAAQRLLNPSPPRSSSSSSSRPSSASVSSQLGGKRSAAKGPQRGRGETRGGGGTGGIERLFAKKTRKN